MVLVTVAVVVVIVVLGLAWWSSGRARPLSRRGPEREYTEAEMEHLASSQRGRWSAGPF